MIDLRRLRLLRELHARGTIAAVADALSYSPSSVSQQLAELQREVGVTLFERDGRRLRFTEPAHVLVRHAEALLDRMEQAEAEVATAAGVVAGIVRIAAFQTASINLVVPAVADLAVRHPGLRVEIEDAEPQQALEALALRECELAICDQHEPRSRPGEPGVTFEELHVEPVHLVLPRDHPVPDSGHGVRLADLSRQPWAAGSASSSHGRMVLQTCTELGGFRPDVRHRTTDLLVLLALIRTGQAVTLLPHLAHPESDPAVRVHDIAEGPVRRRILLATRTADLARPSITAVRDALRDVARLVRVI